jgi:WhiB family redox-sensing transcriptional regulator
MMWMDDAACLEEDPELFFPDSSTGGHASLAKAVCRRCDVLQVCLSWALETEQPDGIWGGQNARERRRLQRRLDELQRARPAA